MIYSIEIEKFPEKGQYTECTSYSDENGYEWKIAVVESGFFFAYFGGSYFKDTYFSTNPNGKHVLLMNSGCFYFDTKDHEVFYHLRSTVQNGWTDDIWETISELLEERLEHDPGLTECEIVKR